MHPCKFRKKVYSKPGKANGKPNRSRIMDFFLRTPDFLRGSREYEGALRIVRRLQKAGYLACFAGGAPRDLFLGRRPADFDIATSAPPEETSRLFPHSHPLGAAFGILLVPENGFAYEIASFREEGRYRDGRHPEQVTYTADPELDAQRRDFTINSLFYDPERELILDFAGGIRDLHRGILRTVGDPMRRLSEDYLRILRAVRFAVRFQCVPDPETLRALRRFAPNLAGISAERIRDEVDKMLTGPRPSQAFRMMSELGILPVILPELERLRGLEQPELYHPEGDVFEHTMLMLDHIAVPGREIAWTVLLHDVGKYETFSRDAEGIPHFYGHEVAGALLAEKILKRLRSPVSLTEKVCTAVRNHMRFASVDKMKASKWRRMMGDANFPLELELHRIDCTASHGMLGNYVLMLDRMREFASGKENSCVLPDPLVNGKDLIALGMKPGPALGRMLERIRDLQLEGTLTGKEDAVCFVRETLSGSSSFPERQI